MDKGIDHRNTLLFISIAAISFHWRNDTHYGCCSYTPSGVAPLRDCFRVVVVKSSSISYEILQ